MPPRVTDSTRSANFVEFLGDIVEQTPPGLEVHCIVDNLSAHSTAGAEEFLDLEEHHHVFLHHTPTHASWLNQVERFLSILSRRLLRHGEFGSVEDLATKGHRLSRRTTGRPGRSAGPTRADPSRRSRDTQMTQSSALEPADDPMRVFLH